MLNVILGILIISFVIYEQVLHRYYKNDLNEEKLISYFSNTRMQLMKMLYMKEISHNSYYFNFMIRATSYSIRTIYYRKNKLSKEQFEILEDMLKFLDTENLKKEFKNLNSEQKELFAKTALKIMELYCNTKLKNKILWNLYILEMSSKLVEVSLKLLKLLSQKEYKQIKYISSIEESYSLREYALAA